MQPTPRFRSRRLPRACGPRRSLCAVLVAASAGPLFAAEVPPELVANFTRRVQPLLLNKCAAGACHGGPAAHEPRFHRADVRGAVDRAGTLTNLETLLEMLGPEADAQRLVTTLSGPHPGPTPTKRLAMTPLTPRERATLESWIVAYRAARPLPTHAAAARRDAEVRPAAYEEPATPARPNRFRDLLEAAANPPPLPPPQEPQGLILGTDEPSE